MATEVTQIDVIDFNQSSYNQSDINLITKYNNSTYLESRSIIEFFIYDVNKNLLIYNPKFTDYKVLNNPTTSNQTHISDLILDPESDLLNQGFSQGEYITYYNFLNKYIGSDIEQLYITEISSDRTEIRLNSNILSSLDIIEQSNQFIKERLDSNYFLDFYLNFGDNNLILSTNIALDDENPDQPSILIKLYNPLPDTYDLKSTLWVVSSIDNPIIYDVKFEDQIIIFNDTVNIQGPNFNLAVKNQINNSTLPLSYVDIISSQLTSSLNNITNLLDSKEIKINVDYTDFTNFIHFSSAQTRLENFKYKVELIEDYTNSINLLNTTTTSSLSVSSSIALYEDKINSIISNFDGYDYFLYYDNSEYSWPKTNTSKPYILANSTSSQAISWFGSSNEYSPSYGGVHLSASMYDNINKDQLLKTIPEYLREDEDNQQYEIFIDMIAQHYDNIWIYYNEITQKYNIDNRLNYGISKDLIADAIKDFGINLYQNNFSNEDLYSSFLGLTPSGNLFPFPNITSSLNPPTGYEYIENFISASNDVIPLDDVNKSIYKRIYHNLPYLLKSKGTLPGLRSLITSYGIPDTILQIREYGGKDKVNSNDWDYWKNVENSSFSTSGSNFISSSFNVNPLWNSQDDRPSTLMFRFKADADSISNPPLSQSIWYADSGAALTLDYVGTAQYSGSYSGSIVDPYNQYATLAFYPDSTSDQISSSINLPFYNGDWWSVMITRNTSSFTLYAQNKVYEGGDNGTTIGFSESSSISGNDIPWYNSSVSYFPVSFSLDTTLGYDFLTYDTTLYDVLTSTTRSFSPFSGSYQEIRYYNSVMNKNVFDDYTMNPSSITGNTDNESSNQLIFRAPLGNESYFLTSSIHPKSSGTHQLTQSFNNTNDFYFDNTPIFDNNTEYFFYDQPIAGIKNPISDKIRIEDNIIPEGNTLSAYKSLNHNSPVSSSYTTNINILDVSFSPQNEINNDIMSHMGGINLGEYIGNPSQRFDNKTTYPDLNSLKDVYFEKYNHNYNLKDFIRLIKFFDNSLFKMIKDFIPARNTLTSGIVIKQHLLERNKYSQPQTSYIDETITGSVKPQWDDFNDNTVENFSIGSGGTSNNIFNSISSSQNWVVNHITPSGSIQTIHNSFVELYNGEYSGSYIQVSDQNITSGSGDIFHSRQFSQSLLNNVTDNRKNTKYQNVDYSTGISTPINLLPLISGSSIKAEIQDSYYSTQRHINPRYNGVKNTSQYLNVWSNSDVNVGNYGKTPSMESLKNSIAYCDNISSSIPLRMDTSQANVKYLIKDNSTVVIPNQSYNALYDTQGTFISNHLVSISNTQKPNQLATLPKKIIKGGYRLEPILYNQLYTEVSNSWASNINLYDSYTSGSISSDWTAKIGMGVTSTEPHGYEEILPLGSWTTLDHLNTTYRAGSATTSNTLITTTPDHTSTYKVITAIKTDAVDLIFTVSLKVSSGLGTDVGTGTIYYRIFNKTQNIQLGSTHTAYTPPLSTTDPNSPTYSFSQTLLSTDMVNNDEYEVQVYTADPLQFVESPSYFEISQNPIANSDISTTSLWVSSSYPAFPANSIYTSNPSLVSLFETPNVKQLSMPTSSFPTITEDWSIKAGDEFRFDGQESHTLMVQDAYVSGSNLIVIMDQPIKPSPAIDINHFLIRRYVPDSSQIIFEGIIPPQLTQPYLLKPEYVTDNLNKNLQTIIPELVKNGLIM